MTILPVMVRVAGGSFNMGGEQEIEKPIHKVTVADFKIAKYPVTQGQWEAVMGTNPSHFSGNANHPVERVSWEDCQQFLNRLNEQTGLNFRLPTEAEWEYAARGGNLSKGLTYSGGNELNKIGWFEGNSNGQTHPVGKKLPNELGIYDMSGNVWEWCQDDWLNSYTGCPVDGTAWESKAWVRDRVIRGGSWVNFSVCMRVANRSHWDSQTRGKVVGIRPVRSL